ncbi:hypothetical protein HDU96_006926 [Phlyctochytrium bullatum]|nr:hypothetical protein HDU96_006926 [Phlyctochytrium bullatum]
MTGPPHPPPPSVPPPSLRPSMHPSAATAAEAAGVSGPSTLGGPALENDGVFFARSQHERMPQGSVIHKLFDSAPKTWNGGPMSMLQNVNMASTQMEFKADDLVEDDLLLDQNSGMSGPISSDTDTELESLNSPELAAKGLTPLSSKPRHPSLPRSQSIVAATAIPIASARNPHPPGPSYSIAFSLGTGTVSTISSLDDSAGPHRLPQIRFSVGGLPGDESEGLWVENEEENLVETSEGYEEDFLEMDEILSPDARWKNQIRYSGEFDASSLYPDELDHRNSAGTGIPYLDIVLDEHFEMSDSSGDEDDSNQKNHTDQERTPRPSNPTSRNSFFGFYPIETTPTPGQHQGFEYYRNWQIPQSSLIDVQEDPVDLRWPHRNLQVLPSPHSTKSPSSPSYGGAFGALSKSDVVASLNDTAQGVGINGDDDTVKDEDALSGDATDDDTSTSLDADENLEAESDIGATAESLQNAEIERNTQKNHFARPWSQSSDEEMDLFERELDGEMDDEPDRQGRSYERTSLQRKKKNPVPSSVTARPQKASSSVSYPRLTTAGSTRTSYLYDFHSRLLGELEQQVVVEDHGTSNRQSIVSNLTITTASNSTINRSLQRSAPSSMNYSDEQLTGKSPSAVRAAISLSSQNFELVDDDDDIGAVPAAEETHARELSSVLDLFDHYVTESDPPSPHPPRPSLSRSVKFSSFVDARSASAYHSTPESAEVVVLRSLRNVPPQLRKLPQTHFHKVPSPPSSPASPLHRTSTVSSATTAFSSSQPRSSVEHAIPGLPSPPLEPPLPPLTSPTPIHDLLRAYRTRKTSPALSVRYLFDASFNHPTYNLPAGSPNSPYASLGRWTSSAASLARNLRRPSATSVSAGENGSNEPLIKAVDPRAVAMYLLALALIHGVGCERDPRLGTVMLEQATAVAAEAISVNSGIDSAALKSHRRNGNTTAQPRSVFVDSPDRGIRERESMDGSGRKRSKSLDAFLRRSVSSALDAISSIGSESVQRHRSPVRSNGGASNFASMQGGVTMSRSGSDRSSFWNRIAHGTQPKVEDNEVRGRDKAPRSPKGRSRSVDNPTTSTEVFGSTTALMKEWEIVSEAAKQRPLSLVSTAVGTEVASTSYTFTSSKMDMESFPPKSVTGLSAGHPIPPPPPQSIMKKREISTPRVTVNLSDLPMYVVDVAAHNDPAMETFSNSPAWAAVLRMAEGLEDTVHLYDNSKADKTDDGKPDAEPPCRLYLSLRATREFLRLPTRSLGVCYATRASAGNAGGTMFSGNGCIPTVLGGKARTWRRNMMTAVYYFEIASSLGDGFSSQWLHDYDTPFRAVRSPLSPYKPDSGSELFLYPPKWTGSTDNVAQNPKRRSRSVESLFKVKGGR